MTAIVEAVKPELINATGQKARAELTTRGRVITLHFEANDTATLRAIMSSHLRMFTACLRVCESLVEIDTPTAVQKR